MPMSDKDKKTTKDRVQLAVHLQEIEGNPLDSDQIAMFEMFEREGWPHEKRLSYIKKRAKAAARVPVAE